MKHGRMKTSLPQSCKGLTHMKKAGAELATIVFYIAYEKQSLILYVLQKTWFQCTEMGLTLREMQECP